MSKKSNRIIDPARLSKSCLARNPGLLDAIKNGASIQVVTQERSKNAPGGFSSLVSTISGPNTPEKPPKVKAGPQMTQTEREFKAMLERENPGCRVLFSRYSFLLSTDCRYVPDFAVVHPVEWLQRESGASVPFCSLELHEVKGAHLFRGATKSMTTATLVKPKLAAELFPWHRWFRATKSKDGTWSREEYRAAQ